MTRSRPPIALSIAGSDSGGGAGIQADLKTFHAFGVFGTTAVTAITAQNTLGVRNVHPVPLETVRAQLDAVLEDLRPDALKTGMLATSDLVEVVADALREYGLDRYVMDPVMVATSGDRLLDEGAATRMVELLLPRAALVTPNMAEAAILTGQPVTGLVEMETASRRLVDMGANAALITGGHLEGDPVDLLWDGRDERVWRRPRIPTRHTHGTGCTLSAAVTAGLASGFDLVAAVDRAIDFVTRAIESAPEIGHGNGPIDHHVPVR